MIGKLQFSILLSMALALASAAAAPVTEPAHPATDAMARDWVANTGPGISIAMARGDVDPIFVSAGNLANKRGAQAVDADTLWRMYSMTKPITALAAIALIEDRQLGLDDPISNYLHEYSDMKVIMYDDKGRPRCSNGKRRCRSKYWVTENANSPITVRNLMTHTAGLGYSIPTDAEHPLEDPLMLVYADKGLNPWQISRGAEGDLRLTRPKSLEDFAERLSHEPLLAQPGTHWAYSVGLDLLAAVIENITLNSDRHETYDQYVQRRLFAPLGINSGFWKVPGTQSSHLSSMYWSKSLFHGKIVDPGSNSQWLDEPEFHYGGAGLVLSARDYDKLARMLLNHGAAFDPITHKPIQVLSQDSVDNKVMANLLPNPETVDTHLLTQMFPNVGTLGFGAGGYVVLAPASTGGRGKGTYGWGGAAGTTFWVDRQNGVRVTGMINRLGDAGALDGPLVEATYLDLMPLMH